MSNYLAYRNHSLTIEDRIEDLLSRMTIEEKIGQLMMPSGRGDFEKTIRERCPGSMLNILENAEHAIELSLQTRLGIPLLVAEDCIHGHSFWKDATIFPTQLAMACSWNPELVESVARVAGREIAATGVHWTFSPVLCLTRDLRWGRVGETFGEDPYLDGKLGAAMIRGYHGEDLSAPESVLANAKHYAGYSETQGGRDSSEADLSRRKLRSYFLPPFQEAVRAGCLTMMSGYQAIEGTPCAANRWLLRDVLKDEWGFKGLTVTDWDTVGAMVTTQKTAPDYDYASAIAVKAGNDVIMSTPEFYDAALRAIRRGLLDEESVDDSCRRILRVKFAMGLFENPRRPDMTRQREIIACRDHQQRNLEIARESVVLLQNDGVLPLREEGIQRVAVIGPNADDDMAQLGDWTLGCPLHGDALTHSRSCTQTVLDGLRQISPKSCRVEYARGCSVDASGRDGIDSAAALAARSDVAIVVVGDVLDFVGERHSTATLDLQGGQLELLERLRDTGTRLVIVLINSKPLVLPEAIRGAAAIVEAFNPGMEGGTAIAEILWGNVNPSGKLCVSFPRHVGQQPSFYSQVRGQHGDRYADLTQEALFPFGHGLSYTTFRYENLRVIDPVMERGKEVRLTVDVINTGARAGTEIVQVYVSDEVTSVTWVDRELKAFQRVALEPGETRTINLMLPFEAFSLVDAEGRRVVEAGRFHILVGGTSCVSDLLRGECELPSEA